ncbi:Membrane protein TerC, possibly involved in tellurium resistance [Hymenobacter gelipurpurascens]|uniref:Membrane protein TerC, possibly involved in tellurium resistance n=1 Tax=Hymenobacter gelipurpurascens TaxID=89968 RepID=A0A212UCL7_9BACT|nr:TerC family protein [Hymenobacter gelipurpurascens]SNC75933.1 Membrane protein TerC, possibly involved in tellurium resistance [Hymenobacter gelipurpurascens]
MNFDFSVFSNPQTWVSLLTLTFMEIVLGIDNIIFISIVVNRLPREQQKRGRSIGLLLALLCRIGLLMSISWIIGLKASLFDVNLPWMDAPFGVTGRDLILLAGGLFLIGKSTTEIHTKLQGEEDESNAEGGKATFGSIILQIIVIDIVFSFDSILTAVGLVDNVLIMILAVILSMAVMMAFSGVVADFVNRNPTIKMLALSFLIMIGVMLVMEAFHKEIEKGYIYFAMFFSLIVEVLNMRLRKKATPVHLHESKYD